MESINIERLERKRKRQGLSIVELSNKVGMTKQAYYDILNNKSTKISTLKKIADTLGSNYKDLLL